MKDLHNEKMRRVSDTKITSKRVSVICIGISVFIIAGWLMTQDIKDQEKELQHYCEMVNNGHWGNYKRIDTKKCGAE